MSQPLAHQGSPGTQMIYNVVLVSDVQQSDSVICVYIHFQIHSSYRLLQNIGAVPWAIQWVLVGYLFYI